MKLQFLSFFLRIFWIFPVKKNQIFFLSDKEQYICNPKYIYEYLKKNYGTEMLYIWAYKDNSKKIDSSTVFVSYNSLKGILFLLTSKFIIYNTGIKSYFPFRKNQVIINTWHGGGAYKKVGKDIEKDRYYYYINKKRGMRTNYFISSCQVFSYVMSKAYSIKYENFLPFGMPRNDIFFSSSISSEIIKNRLGIDLSKSIILYAPTYRGKYKHNESCINDIKINFQKVIYAAEKRFNNKFILLYRSHQEMKNIIINNDSFFNVTNYPDMQELLFITDILITDYSSSIWDFSFTFRPGFLFTPDLQEYNDKRGFYTPIGEWPFPYAISNEQLCDNILNYNEEDNFKKIKNHHINLGSYENGKATENISKLIINTIKEK